MINLKERILKKNYRTSRINFKMQKFKFKNFMNKINNLKVKDTEITQI